jgi:hypothetical protein
MKIWTAMVVSAVLVTGCTSAQDRITFDGQLFNAKLRTQDKQLDLFIVTVRPVSKSLQGARDAGAYEAISHCVSTFGSSDILWTVGPDAPVELLGIDKDTMVLQGRCPGAR